MRRRFLAMAALCCLTPPQALGTELTNPGFEGTYSFYSEAPTCPNNSGDVSPWWQDNSCWPGNESAQVFYSANTASPRSGSSAQSINVQGGILQFVQSVDLSGDKLYTASVWMRADAPIEVTLMLRKLGPPYTTYVSRNCSLTPQWTRYSVSGLTESSPAYFMVRSVDTGTFDLDDASLTFVDATAALPANSVPEDFFAMHLQWGDVAWPGSPIRAVRIWDANGAQGQGDAQWVGTHLAPGVFDWTALDMHIDRAREAEADVVFVLGRPPRWASARPDEPSIYGFGQAAEPADIQTWRDWVTAVATRYPDDIKFWEIWNEPNDTDFYTGTPEKLLELAQEAHSILKSLDPGNQLVSPSPYDLSYLDHYLSLGGGNYADIIGYHFYVIGQQPEVLYDSYIPTARAILQDHGLQAKPLWNTEAGWFAPPPLPDEESVGLVSRSYLLNWVAGIERFFWYSWDANPHGVELALDPDYTVRTPAGDAFFEMAQWLVGARTTRVTKDPVNTWTIELTRFNGTQAYVVWNPDYSAAQPVDFTLPLSWNVQLRRDLDGSEAVLSDQTEPIDARPVLFQQAVVSSVGPTPAAPATSLFLASANPAAGSVRLGFELPNPMRVGIQVFDVAGRRVADIGAQQYAAGRHHTSWDGRVDSGRKAASGVYFVQLRTPAQRLQQRIVLVR